MIFAIWVISPYNVIVIVPFEEGVASKKLLQRAKSLGSLQPKQFVKEYLNIQGDQEIRARFSNQKKNMKAANKYNEIWRVFSKFSLVFKNLYGIKKIPV